MSSGSPFTPHEVTDAIFTVEGGVNMGVSPFLLQNNQLASSVNCTVRGTLLTQRPPFQLIDLQFPGSPTESEQAFLTGKYQGGGYFKPDNGFESMIFQIGGRLFQITPGANTASFLEVTVPGSPNPASAQQAWLWQSEKWMIVMDGSSIPIFFDQTATPMSRRSTWNSTTFTLENTTVTSSGAATNTIPAVGATMTIDVADASQMSVNDAIWIAGSWKPLNYFPYFPSLPFLPDLPRTVQFQLVQNG